MAGLLSYGGICAAQRSKTSRTVPGKDCCPVQCSTSSEAFGHPLSVAVPTTRYTGYLEPVSWHDVR